MGSRPYLSKKEELVDLLITCANAGYCKTQKDVLSIVGTILQKKGIKKDGYISDGWWSHFHLQWPQLTLHKGDSFPLVHMEMTNFNLFESYFRLLEETLVKYGLKDKPGQIYNCDESGMLSLNLEGGQPVHYYSTRHVF